MSILSFVENIGTYASAAETLYTAIENVVPETEQELNADWQDVQAPLAACKSSWAAIAAASGFVEKAEDFGSFLGKCIALTVALAEAIVSTAGSQAYADVTATATTLLNDVKGLIGDATSRAAVVTTVTGGTSDDTATLNSEAAAASS